MWWNCLKNHLTRSMLVQLLLKCCCCFDLCSSAAGLSSLILSKQIQNCCVWEAFCFLLSGKDKLMFARELKGCFVIFAARSLFFFKMKKKKILHKRRTTTNLFLTLFVFFCLFFFPKATDRTAVAAVAAASPAGGSEFPRREILFVPALRLSTGCPNRRWGQLWANGPQWDPAPDPTPHKAAVIFFEDFAVSPQSSLRELIKHWTAWGCGGGGGREGSSSVITPDWLDCTVKSKCGGTNRTSRRATLWVVFFFSLIKMHSNVSEVERLSDASINLDLF